MDRAGPGRGPQLSGLGENYYLALVRRFPLPRPNSRPTVLTQCQRRCPLHATTATTRPATSRMRTTVDIFSMTLSALEISAR